MVRKAREKQDEDARLAREREEQVCSYVVSVSWLRFQALGSLLILAQLFHKTRSPTMLAIAVPQRLECNCDRAACSA